MRRLIFLCLLILSTAAATEARQFTLSGLDHTPEGADSPAVTRALAAVALPVQIAGLATTHGVRFRQLTVEEYPAAPNGLPGANTYREIRYDGSVTFPAGERWTASIFVSPAISSDFEADLSVADFDFQGAVFFNRPWSTGTLGLGLAYRNRLDVFLLPLLAVKRPLTERWSLDMLAPARIAAWYAASSRVSAGLTATYNQVSHHLADHPLNRLDHTLSTAAPAVRLRLGGLPLMLEAKAGVVLVNELEYGSGDGEVVQDAGDGWFFGFSLLADR